ncbi:MAG: helix-turn-helix transcriptional regulator [Negativicutes bacterium]|nr:helix-turn-helix transcriptional regulator [Negativicutes bacterium]
MADSTLHTPEEVAKALKISRFTVYELIKRGDLPAHRIGRSMRIEAVDLERYILSTKRGESVQLPALPAAAGERRPGDSSELIICGQDMVLDILSSHLEPRLRGGRVLRRYVGSIGGLIALYNRSVNIATAHLWDGDSGEYNVPYVRRYLPGHRALLVNLVYRNEGFYVTPGNPKNITGWPDLTRPDIRFVNRERGAGARVLLDEMLRKLDIDFSSITGYAKEEMSHLAVASCVARGEADVGIGIEKAAMQVQKVEFIPLQKERLDLIMLRHDADKPDFQVLLSILRSADFRKEIAGIGGYDVSKMGEIIAEV